MFIPYGLRQVSIVLSFQHFQNNFKNIFTLNLQISINFNMVFSRSQYENMIKEQLIQELADINSSFETKQS